jgi:hypothetical protein
MHHRPDHLLNELWIIPFLDIGPLTLIVQSWANLLHLKSILFHNLQSLSLNIVSDNYFLLPIIYLFTTWFHLCIKFVSVHGHGIGYPGPAVLSPSSPSCLPLPLDKSTQRTRAQSSCLWSAGCMSCREAWQFRCIYTSTWRCPDACIGNNHCFIRDVYVKVNIPFLCHLNCEMHKDVDLDPSPMKYGTESVIHSSVPEKWSHWDANTFCNGLFGELRHQRWVLIHALDSIAADGCEMRA